LERGLLPEAGTALVLLAAGGETQRKR